MKKSSKRIYPAGAMSSSNPIQFMENLRKGMRLSTEILLAGYYPFPVFCDYSLFFQLHDGESIPVETIKESSLAWLEVADAVVLVPGWEGSSGVWAELERAVELGIPIYTSLDALIAADKAHGCLFCAQRFETMKGSKIHITKIHSKTGLVPAMDCPVIGLSEGATA